MKNIYLIGMPGCGKSTAGKYISEKLKMNYTDLDEYIIKRENKSIDEMFSIGDMYFRNAETRALKEISTLSDTVVSTGGGIVTQKENIRIMKESGTVIFIDSDAENILKYSSLDGRPLLKNKNEIFSLYEKRIDIYRSASEYIVDNNGYMCDVLDEIEKIIYYKRQTEE